jgi:hypothetical protein
MNNYTITQTLSTSDTNIITDFKQFCFDVANSSPWDYRFQSISIKPLVSIFQVASTIDDDSQLLDDLQAVLYEFNNDSLTRIFQYLHPMPEQLQVSVEYSYISEWNGEEYEDVASDTTDELMETLRAVHYIVGCLNYEHSEGSQALSGLYNNLNKLV